MPPLWRTDPKGYKPCENEGCAGRGWIRCKPCKGEGSREVESWDYSSSYRGRPRWRTKMCKVCSGEGKIPCDVCNGTGSIARERRFTADVPAELMWGVGSYEPRYPQESRAAPKRAEPAEKFELAKTKALDDLDHLKGLVYLEQLRSGKRFKLFVDSLGREVSWGVRPTPGSVERGFYASELKSEIRSISFETAGAKEKLWKLRTALPDDDKLKNVRAAILDMWLAFPTE